MSRVIDFALTRRAHGYATNHGRSYGSDHNLVVFNVVADGATFRIGLWNQERDRSRHRVAGMAGRVVSLFRLDALLLCESSDYLAAMDRLPGTRLVGFTHRAGQSNTAILVPDRMSATLPTVAQMTRTGWFTTRGGRTPPKYLVSVVLSKRSPDGEYAAQLRVAVGHRPPSVRWRWGILHGPVRRVVAMRSHAKSEVAWVNNRHSLPLLLAEDWNATPHARGRYSPSWVAAKTGMRVLAPSRGTHH